MMESLRTWARDHPDEKVNRIYGSAHDYDDLILSTGDSRFAVDSVPFPSLGLSQRTRGASHQVSPIPSPRQMRTNYFHPGTKAA